jgi:hypothetical protein
MNDYAYSAHLMDNNPVVWVAFGSTIATTAKACERRPYLDQLAVLRLSSTNGNHSTRLTMWRGGTPHAFDPEQVDPARIRAWLQHCDHSHGDRCHKPSAHLVRATVHPGFIDIDRECVVTPDHSVPYVALSYVWGPVETLQARKENIDSLRRLGSLSFEGEHEIPATIQDAMKLCALTGQKYLWVDRVCIIQDDLENKGQHLNAMAEIYAKAEFTIVAADGSHADYGLSGMGRRVEERRKHLIPFPTKTMVDETTNTAGQDRFSGKAWSSRAWTYQEHVFSRRLLYMDKFVSWMCYSATWDEWCSPPNTPSGDEANRIDRYGKGGKLYTINWLSLVEYANMVEQYNSRTLTYDSDILNAFLGVMTQMCEGFPAGFYGGLPEFYFTICLLWQPSNGLRPRFPNAECAPSWSWLEWSGKLDLEMWRCNTDAELLHAEIETAITPVAKFFKKYDHSSDTSSSIDDTFHVVRTHFGVNADATPYRWQKHNGDAASRYEPFYTYLGYDGPSHIDMKRRFRYPIPPFQRFRDINSIEAGKQNLYCSTQRIFLTLGTPEKDAPRRSSDHNDGSYYVVNAPVFTLTGTWAGSIRINALEDEGIPTSEVLEVIRVAKGSVPTKRGGVSLHATHHPFEDCVQREQLRGGSRYNFYFVLWIARDNGTARRKALGTVWDCVWESAKPEDVDIILI